ncbi:MAG: glycosyltransferase [Cyclobacteriaceae bacterium]|nr:glycosyltransferase [Cyclobacteriaceae bacterium]
MKATPRYSVIVPVYNRPEELRELLDSLTRQTVRDFEVIIVEDGSSVTSEPVVDAFRDQLKIEYIVKPNTGPGPSRNMGFSRARGEYFVVFDSDCILPSHYFEAVDTYRQVEHFDAWGGPDRGHKSFTPLQQAMAYTMASALTTGGIRGGGKRLDWFQPRSFNMGLSREVYEKTHGFVFSRMAEDIELSIRMKKAGFRSVLIPEAYVFHKRRTNLKQFYRQVFNFGRGRVQVGRAHSGAIKLTHWLPAFFALGIVALPVVALFSKALFTLGFSILIIYLIALLADAYRVTQNVSVSLLSIPAALTQLIGYGSGFLKEWFSP